MSKEKTSAIVDEVFSDIESLFENPDLFKDCKPLAFRFPTNYKERFDILQDKTNKRFGKKIQELIMAAIDKADPQS